MSPVGVEWRMNAEVRRARKKPVESADIFRDTYEITADQEED